MQLRRHDSDQRLLQRARRGDEEAFERLYGRYQPRIFAFCRHLTGHREDAEDAVQYTFLAAYRAIVESDQRLDLRPWLFTVARNRCLSLLRARRTRHLGEAPEIGVESVVEEVERREAVRDLVRDLHRLPEEQRAALLLSELGALSHGDVATVLEVPPAKVKALVFQARSSLVSTRDARDASCDDIRRQLATLSGSALRRRMLRRHVGECPGCRDFEAAVADQRKGLAALVPPAMAVGGRGAVGALTAAGSGAGGASVGGLLGGGVTGSLMALGTQGAVSVAIAAVVVGGGAAGVVMTGSPTHLIGGDSHAAVVARGVEDDEGFDMTTPRSGLAGGGVGPASPMTRTVSDPVPVGERPGNPVADAAAGPEAADGNQEGEADRAPGLPLDGVTSGPPGDDPDDALPPGLARKESLPPGLARKDELPPGLAKRGTGAQGNPHGTKGSGGGNANAHGGGDNGKATPPGSAKKRPPQGQAPAGGSPGGPSAGGEGTGGKGQAGADGSGPGNPNPGANGGAGANGNAGGNGNGNAGGNGNGNPAGNGNPGGNGNGPAAATPGQGVGQGQADGGGQGTGGNGNGNPGGPGHGRSNP